MKDRFKMMRPLLFALVLLAWVAVPAQGAGLQLTIQDGKVTLDAQDVTIRQILTEWARVGKTRIVNLERLGGGPVTLKFDALPEKQALDVVLRAVPGYVAAPRETLVANASLYETILVMPTTTAVAAARAPQPSGFPPGVPGGAFSPMGSVGAPLGTAGVTQMRQAPPGIPTPADDPEPPDPLSDPALAAAVAAGLMPAPGQSPTPSPITTPLAPISLPGQTPQSATPLPGPTNPWNAPAGTVQPSMGQPQPPAPTAPPAARPRPQAADR
jgi:hypothetical protein